MIRRLATIGFTWGLLASVAPGQSPGPATGTVQGEVFTTDADGGRSVLPDTRISLDGPSHIETQSTPQGKFALSAIPVGSYAITAQANGMAATQHIEVTAGTVLEVELEMKLQAVTESTTVTASADPTDTTEPSGSGTVGESAVRNMPNIDEQFQSLLPLIPGVIRGPNGLINMKGARSSENFFPQLVTAAI